MKEKQQVTRFKNKYSSWMYPKLSEHIHHRALLQYPQTNIDRSFLLKALTQSSNYPFFPVCSVNELVKFLFELGEEVDIFVFIFGTSIKIKRKNTNFSRSKRLREEPWSAGSWICWSIKCAPPTCLQPTLHRSRNLVLPHRHRIITKTSRSCNNDCSG